MTSLFFYVKNMIDTLIGIKKGMTVGYDARGRRVGATVVSIGSNTVTQVKSSDGNDGYNAVQIAVGERRNLKKPQIGHIKKAGSEKQFAFMREVRTADTEGLTLGQEIAVNQVFAKGDSVKVTGTSKGKGFQGGVRRHGFSGGPKTHGQSDRHRAPGSIGAGTTPGRVYKGHNMAGHMGNVTSSTKGMEVIAIDRTTGNITLKGAVPGAVGGLVTIKKLGRIRGYIAPPEEKEDEEEEGESKENNSEVTASEEVAEPTQEGETENAN